MKSNNSLTGYSLIGILLLALSHSANADILNRGFTAVYEVYHNGTYVGETKRTVRPQPHGEWKIESRTETKGLASLVSSAKIKEVSIIRQKDNMISPIAYQYDQTGGRKERHYQIVFNEKHNKISLIHSDKVIPYENNVQDILSFQLQIMRDMQLGKTTVTYPIIDRKRIQSFTLNKQARSDEDFGVGGKDLKTIKIVSNKSDKGDQFIIFCAPDLEYLPVKIQKIEADGDEAELVLVRFKL